MILYRVLGDVVQISGVFHMRENIIVILSRRVRNAVRTREVFDAKKSVNSRCTDSKKRNSTHPASTTILLQREISGVFVPFMTRSILNL